MSDRYSYDEPWKSARANMSMQQFAKRVLTEENYFRYLDSWNSVLRFLFIGYLLALLVPAIVLTILTDGAEGVVSGTVLGVLWMIFFPIITRFIPQAKLYRKYAKWYKNPHATLDDLDEIFEEDKSKVSADSECGKSKEDSYRLNEQEKKRIQRYCLLPTLGQAFLLMVFASGGIIILLEMIKDVFFHGDTYLAGFFLGIGIMAVYTVAFVVCLVLPRCGMMGSKWERILMKADASMQEKDYSAQMFTVFGTKAVGSMLGRSDNDNMKKAGKAVDAMAAVEAVDAVVGAADDISRNAKQVAAACGVKIPKAGKYVLAIVLLPAFLLIAVYVPPITSANQAMNAQIAVASESVYALQAAFEDGCDWVSIDDPQKRYKDNSYTAGGYLYRDGWSDIEASIYVSVDNDGLIIEVSYTVHIDIEAEKEENLEMAGYDLRELNRMLNNSGVEAISDNLMDTCELPEAFVSRFQEGSYYEKISVKEGENIYVYYETDSEEDYDEHSDSYIYMRIKPED